MKVAFTHNLRLTDVRETEKEAEYDSVETVTAIATAIEAAGHEVEKLEVSGPASNLLERLEAIDPDIIFNTAEGTTGKMREAFYPALFEELGFPYTGSDAYVLTVTLDKWLTKLVLGRQGIDTPRAKLVTPDEWKRIREPGTLGLAFPVIVKPNYEGSSKGIGDDAIVRDPRLLAAVPGKLHGQHQRRCRAPRGAVGGLAAGRALVRTDGRRPRGGRGGQRLRLRARLRRAQAGGRPALPVPGRRPGDMAALVHGAPEAQPRDLADRACGERTLRRDHRAELPRDVLQRPHR